jgi:hypothetical protein
LVEERVGEGRDDVSSFFDGFVGFLVEILREFLEGQRLFLEERKVRKVWLRSLKRVLRLWRTRGAVILKMSKSKRVHTF